MNLEEEVDHYLAGLRDSNSNTNNATIALELNGNKGQETATSSSGNEFGERRLKANRQLLPAGLTRQKASCDDPNHVGQKAVVRSPVLAALKMRVRSPASLTRATAPSIEESVPDANNLDEFSDMKYGGRAFIAGNSHATFSETLALEHSDAHGTDGKTLSEASDGVDVAADNELDIIQHYASSTTSEASLSGQAVRSFGKGSVLANEEEYQVLPPATKIEDEDWDDCRVAELSTGETAFDERPFLSDKSLGNMQVL